MRGVGPRLNEVKDKQQKRRVVESSGSNILRAVRPEDTHAGGRKIPDASVSTANRPGHVSVLFR